MTYRLHFWGIYAGEFNKDMYRALIHPLSLIIGLVSKFPPGIELFLCLSFLARGVEVISGVSYRFDSYFMGQEIISVLPAFKYIYLNCTLRNWKVSPWTE